MLPTNSLDWALWLHENLERAEAVGDGLWHGTLPAKWDFQDITKRIDEHERLVGVHDRTTRAIEFYPAQVGAYDSTEQFLRSNLGQAPSHYAIRNLAFRSGIGAAPEIISRHEAAVKLWSLLARLADHAEQNRSLLHFIKSHSERLAVMLDYTEQDLAQLPSLAQFEADFVDTEHHRNQKRNIVRTALIDHFKGRHRVQFSDVLRDFEALMENLRSSYAMYVAEFSFEKIRAEVEKDNLESTLKLNKTFSEIQNQLLALPVALVLVAGQIGVGEGWTLKNVGIWLGSVVFSVLMGLLIHNQLNAVSAIAEEIRLRWQKIAKQPRDISSRFKASFDELETRQGRQKRLLWVVAALVALSLVFSTIVLLWASQQPIIPKPPAARAAAESHTAKFTLWSASTR